MGSRRASEIDHYRPTMYRPFLHSAIRYNDSDDFRLDCGALESLELIQSTERDGSPSCSLVSKKCATTSDSPFPDFGILQPPLPLVSPESAFQSKCPVWTIDDYRRRIRRDRMLMHQKPRWFTRIQRLARTKIQLTPQRSPLWFRELLAFTKLDQGPYSDSKYLKNCLSAISISESDFIFAHSAGDQQKILSIYQSEVIEGGESGYRLKFSPSPVLISEKHFTKPIDQVDTKFGRQHFGDVPKIVYKTDEELGLLTLSLREENGEKPAVAFTRLSSSVIADFAFSPHIASEIAYVDSVGVLKLIDCEDLHKPTTVQEMDSMLELDSFNGVAWTDHPRLILIHDSSKLCQVDSRDGSKTRTIWTSSAEMETMEMAISLPQDPNYVAVVTNRSVNVIDIRRSNVSLNDRRHMLLDRPKFGAATPISSGSMDFGRRSIDFREDQLIFLAGRETGEVIACNFAWRESENVVRSYRAPFRLVLPDEPILWSKCHDPTLAVPRTLIRRLRAPLRGLKTLPLDGSDLVLTLTDVGDVYYQVCGDRSRPTAIGNGSLALPLKARVDVYDERLISDPSWSYVREASMAEFEQNWAEIVLRADLSKTDPSVLEEWTDRGREDGDQCALCFERIMINKNGIRKCGNCNLSFDRASKVIGRREGKANTKNVRPIDSALLDVVSDANGEDEATNAIMQIFEATLD